MSSGDDTSPRSFKKRKLQRACDNCRRKKVRCDGRESLNNRCSECIAQRIECTYTSKNRYLNSYVERLENRLERMEKLVNQLRPNEEALMEPFTYDREKGKGTPNAPSSHPTGSYAVPVSHQKPSSLEDFDSSDEDDGDIGELADDMRGLTVDSHVYHYHGKSSGLAFLRSAVDLQNLPHLKRRHGSDDKPPPWLQPVFEDNSPLYTDYPPDDLLNSLVELYFRNINDLIPLLHEPSFKKAVADRHHRHHRAFGATVLLVCANASRYTRDPRVYSNGPEKWQSAGWKWYEQVRNARAFPFAPGGLFDLQIYVLMSAFVHGTLAPHTTWPIVGAGIRTAVDAGIHRKKMRGATPTVEEELSKRAFWILVFLEWMSAYGFGRPSSIQDEDIDADLPMEVDDEYWTTPEGEPSFRQPPGKPSKISYFVHTIRLCKILARATRTIYRSNKLRAQFVHGDPRGEERLVAEFDSDLNKWADSLPAHLRWDADREDRLWLLQSASLCSQHSQVQIAVHRPFISTSRPNSSLAFPSLIICINAARSGIQALDILCKRNGSPHGKNTGSLFISAAVLLMNVMAQKRSGKSHVASGDLELVKKALEMIRIVKDEMPVSDVFRDVLQGIFSVANSPPGSQGHASAKKASKTKSPSQSASGNTRSLANGESNAYISAALPRSSQTSLHNPSYTDIGLSNVTSPVYTAPPSATSSQPQWHQSQLATGVSMFTPSEPQQPSGQSGGYQCPQVPLGLDLLTNNESTSIFSLANNPESATSASLGEQTPQSVPSTFDFVSVDDTISMWSSAPAAFQWDDWRTYFTSSNDGSFNFDFTDT